MVVETLREKLTASGDDTFGAKIEFEVLDAGDGFDAPDLPENLKTCLNSATKEVFGADKEPTNTNFAYLPPTWGGLIFPFAEIADPLNRSGRKGGEENSLLQ